MDTVSDLIVWGGPPPFKRQNERMCPIFARGVCGEARFQDRGGDEAAHHRRPVRDHEDDPIERVTVREVCGRAGITRSTLYTHFSSVYAFACGADEDLPSAACGVVDVPVVAASRFEAHVEERELAYARVRERVQEALSREVLREPCVGLSQAEDVRLKERGLVGVFHVYASFPLAASAP